MEKENGYTNHNLYWYCTNLAWELLQLAVNVSVSLQESVALLSFSRSSITEKCEDTGWEEDGCVGGEDEGNTNGDGDTDLELVTRHFFTGGLDMLNTLSVTNKK